MMDDMQRHLDPAIGIDAACIGLFVIVGRSSHHEGNAVVETLRIALPFLVALVVMWVAVAVLKLPRGREATGGALIWLGTVAIGLLLRRFVFDDGTAMAFIIVTTLFLGLLMNGWRAALARRMAR
jgi:hypothetical protein